MPENESNKPACLCDNSVAVTRNVSSKERRGTKELSNEGRKKGNLVGVPSSKFEFHSDSESSIADLAGPDVSFRLSESFQSSKAVPWRGHSRPD